MGIKKAARPINKAKNEFVKWLKDNGADNIEVFGGDGVSIGWGYYRSVTAFRGEIYYNVYFMLWQGEESIDYQGGEYTYSKMSIEDFKQLIP